MKPCFSENGFNAQKQTCGQCMYNVHCTFSTMYISLYQIFLKSTVYEISSLDKRPWKGMDQGNNFRKKIEKMSGILRQWPLSLHRKMEKLQNMAPILPILKISHKFKKKLYYQYSIGGLFLFYIFCCKMETVDFFNEKYAKYAKMSLKLPLQNKKCLKNVRFQLFTLIRFALI